jgi:Na+-transporting NADH:ubiquinone oxidoreductase subunit NqrB
MLNTPPILATYWQRFLSDARHIQIMCLLLFLAYGWFALDWQPEAAQYAVLLTSTLVVQLLATFLVKGDFSSWKSALISGLGLCLLFKTDSLWVCALGGFLTIGSKFILRYKGKHIFNPTNLGIILSILLTNAAYISPGQWGSSMIFIGFLSLLGVQILLKVKRLETGFVFLFAFLAMEFARNILWLGWAYDFFFHQFTSGTLLLFSFFMITDPVTTPSHRSARILWAIIVAIVTYILIHFYYVNGAPIWALFFCSFLTPIFDKIWKSSLFRWTSASQPHFMPTNI